MTRNKIYILCLEDNLGDYVLIRSFLEEVEEFTFDIQQADRLSAGLNMMNEKTDIVLLDLGLPDSKGLDTLHEFQKAFPLVPVLVLTGNSDSKTGIQAVQDGAQDYLIKNEITPDLLSRSIVYAIERKNSSLQLQEARIKAEQADKLKTVFLSNMSHDLRTPMTSIIGFSDLLKRDPDSSQRDEFLDMIILNGEILLALLNDVIDISKIESGQLKIYKQPVDIMKLLNEIHANYKEKLRVSAGAFKLLYVPPDLKHSVVNTDKARLFQIFTNLLDNAFKFTDKGYVQFGAESDDDVLRFFVKDSGTGIPQDKLQIIFERFGQVEDTFTRNKAGTGLGLNISKQLASLLGGDLYAKSTTGKGSEFYFHIPLDVAAAGDIHGLNAKSDGKRITKDITGKNILVVEDIDSNYLLIKTTLELRKLNVHHAATGESALEIFKSKQNIDLILMDLRLPVMNGYEAMKQIRTLDQEVPIIVQSALVAGAEKKLAFESGCDEFLQKPVRPRQLIETLHRYL